MPQTPIEMFPFVAGSYLSRSRNFDAQRTVNLYPEASGSGNSKSIAALIGTPGCRQIDTLSGGPTRGYLRFTAGIAIAVTGNTVWKLTDNGNGTVTSVFLAFITNLSTPVGMASNGTTVMMVTGSAGYAIDPVAGTVTQIVDLDFHGADAVWFIDGYFVFNWPGTQKYQITRLYSTVIDPLDFASAEGAPDLLVSLIVVNNELLLLGENTAEFHANSGNVDFPFELIRGTFIEQGCAAKFSVAKMTDGNGVGTAFWLSRNEAGQGMVVRNIGYQPKRISDHALEFAIQNYSRIDDATAFTYQQEGHNFYMLSFPTANATWCYDTSTELWHERSYTPTNSSLIPNDVPGRHLAQAHMFFAGQNLVGSYLDGSLFAFDLDHYEDGGDGALATGDVIHRIRQCPHLSAGDLWQIFDRLWIDMETGVGISGTGTDANPHLIVEWSDDGGYSFPNSMLVPIGKIGERKVRAVARRLGKSKDRVFRVTHATRTKCVYNGAGCNVRVAA